MLIETTHQAITKLSRILPKAFVFVIDTTDRTFLFKSNENPESQAMILKLDQDMGIDKLVKKQGYTIQNFCSREVGIRSIGINTYVGYCLEDSATAYQSLSHAQQAVINQQI